MAGYLSFSMRLSTTEFPITSMLALCSLSEFRPVSLGAIEGHETGDHWFLAGYALEDFQHRFAAQAPSKPASVELVPANDGANRQYLEHIARAVDQKVPLKLSLYEHASEAARITFLDEVGIGDMELQKCAQWVQRHPDSVSYLYGAISLMAPSRAQPQAPWKRAFREVVGSLNEIGPPFVLLRVGREPLAKSQMEVAVFSWSTVWLGDGNLSQLVTLVEAVARSLQGRVESSSLRVEGNPFIAHENDLRTSFATVTGEVG